MQVRLLGPVDVTVRDVVRPVRGLRRKALLAALALHAGHPVDADRLIEIVWDGRPPSTASNSLQRHVSYLRGDLGARETITASLHGYVLDLPGEGTDVDVAERLVRESRDPGDPAGNAARLRTALALWRGRPLADVSSLSWMNEQAERLTRIELEAVQALVDARLALGEHAPLVPDLERLAGRHPYHEQIHHKLMLALYRSGRQAEALNTYQRLRTTLADELGIHPSRELRELAAAILRQDATLDPPAAPVRLTSTPTAGPVPAQLPVPARGFTGRRRELAQLDELLGAAQAAHRTGSATTVVVVLSGTAGVGKTTFATHWAHQTAGRFPDGQLYVNLHGFDANGALTSPAAAIRGFLDAYGVPAQQIPAGLAAQSALYRSVLAGKRTLVVLDNARDAEQVRPLLPAAPGCLVLITSRNQLTPLVASEGAHPLVLDLLPPQDARDLLARRIGAARVAAEPATVDDIIAQSARLPLALAIVAARAATRPAFPLAALAAELRQAADGPDTDLGPFHAGDPATDMRAVFSWSYRTLSPRAARLFRLLGLHPGPDITVPAVASLAGLPTAQIRELLTELTRTHLLTEHAPGRYTFHDLLRAYARELAGIRDSAEDRHHAQHRMFDHYLHSADSAARRLDPHRETIIPGPPHPDVLAETFAGYGPALAWYTAEKAILTATIEQAARCGFDGHSWRLAWTLFDFLDIHGYWHDLITVQSVALASARRLADGRGQAHAHWGLARAHAQLTGNDEALTHFQHALALFEQTGDRTSQAHTQLNLAWANDREGRYAQALLHAREATALYEAIGDLAGQADGHNAIGWYLTHLGEHEQALTYCRQSLTLHEETGDQRGITQAWDSLGYVHTNLSEFDQAADCYQRALDLIRQLRIRYDETIVLTHLGDSRHAAGDVPGARLAWRHALTILDELQHQDAAAVRTKLHQLAVATRPTDDSGRTTVVNRS
ncbi:AfsR/SARP family transcriptional regulator [Micromonospora halophytica]|uniref:DNA-binding transcriptional activator of the SARP family n=1 Tax=Micromonospora halophytica TaxID=47864 RepID=A0A1C5J6Y3_9ACTN|nr:BTAD domain-containing putative transcriptional regulator [Micromonospora halophytica]SCG66307.1 DNA-binding transcriptional activator of the SARP family [Micromonospora halophytica]